MKSVMKKCFCLLLMLHFTEGCHLSGNGKLKEVTGYTGGSVLLPCSCTNSPSTVKFTWLMIDNTPQNEIFQNGNYMGRLKLFNQSSPTNLSLLISDLKKTDGGFYRCEVSQDYKDIWVNIKGCDLDKNKQTVEVTGHSGDSVVLPCSCTELQDKPLQLMWTYTSIKHRTTPKEIYPDEQSERHRGRVKLLHETSPGNLSLHISNLTADDQGEYHCSVLHQHLNITLSVQEEKEIDKRAVFFLLSLLPVVMLLAALALIYWKCRGRDAKEMTNDGLVLVSSENENQADVNPDNLPQGQNLKQDENEDVTYASVAHVKTAVKKDHKQTIMEEHSEYASIK